MLLDSKEIELGSSDQEACLSEGKNTRIVLVPCSRVEVRSYRYPVVQIFLRSLGAICYDR